MLIVCSGADSYRSLEKARALESAYCEKYDAHGCSVERLPSGKEGVEALLSATSGASLFSQRRFIRVDGIIRPCPKAKRDALLRTLSRDVEMTIVVSVEEGELKEADVKELRKLPKFIQYNFSPLGPPQFAKWASEFASKHEVTDQRCIRDVITRSQGDAWQFINEFWKIRAGGESCASNGRTPNNFEVIDSFLQTHEERFRRLKQYGDAQSIMAQAGNQVRSLVLVKSNHVHGIHPFVIQKFRRMACESAAERFQKIMTAFVWSRTGHTNAEEALDILV